MVNNILQDLKTEQPYLFQTYTDEEMVRLINHYLELYHELKWKLPQYSGKGVYNAKFKRIVRKYLKYRKPHERHKPYPKGVQDHRKVPKEIREANRKKALKKYQSSPRYKIMHSVRVGMWRVLRGGQKKSKALVLLGCSVDQLKSHLESQFTEGMTWDNYGKWHIDHIKPLSSVNPEIEQELKSVAHYTNLRPLWAIDNMKKGSLHDGKRYSKGKEVTDNL